MKVLVIAPHADDEILGVGGTISRLINEGADVYVAVITSFHEGLREYGSTGLARREAIGAHEFLGVKETILVRDIPAVKVDVTPHMQVNKAIRDLVVKTNPDVMFIPFAGDIHKDHRLIFESCMVAVRPNSDIFPARVYAYETLSETNWNAPYLSPPFTPNLFIDITDHLERKIQAFEKFNSQVRTFPHERSSEAIKILAKYRGATAGLQAAEAFVLIRGISKQNEELHI